MKILPLGAELFHAEGQTDRQDEANSRFSQFCERVQKLRSTVQFDELLIDFSKSALCTSERCAPVRSKTINHIHIKSGSLRVYKSPKLHFSQVKYVLISTSEP
jgi:hypothetical protein